ncbi:hypothetical protein AVEN_60998-1 [Araneus ventricosus]|uniref:Uncharacterized protein n=1 Tax=Araneus ventricosus TaxID=182803 RepID=A0A4Y2DBT4_ARAVE|nr:hypothetical protein AVEN_60998-1 [Araneus ventricosus]
MHLFQTKESEHYWLSIYPPKPYQDKALFCFPPGRVLQFSSNKPPLSSETRQWAKIVCRESRENSRINLGNDRCWEMFFYLSPGVLLLWVWSSGNHAEGVISISGGFVWVCLISGNEEKCCRKRLTQRDVFIFSLLKWSRDCSSSFVFLPIIGINGMFIGLPVLNWTQFWNEKPIPTSPVLDSTVFANHQNIKSCMVPKLIIALSLLYCGTSEVNSCLRKNYTILGII